MPGLVQSDGPGSCSPLKKSRLSLKFFQKKETKRALDFSEALEEEGNPPELAGPDSCDQIIPAAQPQSPLPCERRESLVPFVGLNNLGNTCYLNSILQVLYYCPGFKDGIKELYNVMSKKKEKQKDDAVKNEEKPEQHSDEGLPVNIELLGSFHGLIVTLEQLQSSYLLNPDKYSDGELATPPRRLLNTLRQLNPMYEGYLQHDAQEVLQCILGYIQEACETIKKENASPEEPVDRPDEAQVKEEENTGMNASDRAREEEVKDEKTSEQDVTQDAQVHGKRKSDTEAGNAKKKSKPLKAQKAPDGNKHFTRSKRKSSSDTGIESAKEEGREEAPNADEKTDGGSKAQTKKKKRPKLSWLKPSGKQPSIFSKFRSMGRISSHAGGRGEAREEEGVSVKQEAEEGRAAEPAGKAEEETEKSGSQERSCLDLMERLFQGRLVLRTRCLECECYTERREDFQDISVPVQEDEPCKAEPESEVSPDPKMELKTLKWAISQFASVERIFGEDKYFCETCHHYTEAERSLLFDKTPEVVTIHLKCFAANSTEFDPYAGLSKVNTPLQTPLRLSLEEWCSRPSKEHYELFAVVMHSGVTITSGHYTTYIRMMDLCNVELRQQRHAEDGVQPEPLNEEEARACDPQDYDDGEVSFNVSGKVPGAAVGKATGKKSSDGVGLLGGQRSKASFDLGGGKTANPEKPVGCATENGKTERGPGHEDTPKGERQRPEAPSADRGTDGPPDPALRDLLDYEGKWMLFDDSEVKLVEEKEFLSSCSPETCSTSTPYLLFYKKVI
ncbi:UBP1 hydrolase, partial [Amia calva]|nr:UBP1 hydrolase [Amia calva]